MRMLFAETILKIEADLVELFLKRNGLLSTQ